MINVITYYHKAVLTTLWDISMRYLNIINIIYNKISLHLFDKKHMELHGLLDTNLIQVC